MDFKKKFNNLKTTNRNKSIEPSLQEVEAKINQIKYAALPPSEEFQTALKNKILMQRPQRKSMTNFSFIAKLKQFFNPKIFAPLVGFALIAALAFGVWHFWGDKIQKGDNPFRGFSKLMVSTANAQDNFELVPAKSDSLGVTADSYYILKSKEQFETKTLKKYLAVEPRFDFQLKEISTTEWQLIPDKPLTAGTIIKVSLSTSYYNESGEQKERDYSWAFQVKDNFKVLNSIPRQAATNVPVESGIEIMFSHDNFIDYEKYFSIEPKTEGRFEKHGRTLVFVPQALNKSQLYTVRIAQGLPLKDSTETLAEDYTFSFETIGSDHLSNSYFRVYTQFSQISTRDRQSFQIWDNNLSTDQVKIDIYRFKDDVSYLTSLEKRDQLPWWSEAKNNYLADKSQLTFYKSFSEKIRIESYSHYLQLPENLPAGFYLIEFSVDNLKNQAWLQVTDLAAYLNVTKSQSLVWLNDLVTRLPVTGARVELVGTSLSTETNNQGVAVFNTPTEIKELNDDNRLSARYYFKIAAQGKSLIIPATSLSNYWRWWSPDEGDEYWRYIYTDRPKYQPTDVIKFWGLLKARNDSEIGQDVTLTLFKEGYVDYYYNPVVIQQEKINPSQSGTFSGEIEIKDLKPDYYSLELKVGDKVVKRQYLTVETYTKPAYELKLIPDRKAAFAGENINFQVQASFFEGTPVPNLPLVFKMPEGDYKFKTDERGQAQLTYTIKYSPCKEQYGCWPRYAYLSLMPQNSELAEIVADASVRFYGPKVYLKNKVSYPKKGQAQVDMTSLNLDLAKAESDYAENLGELPAPNTKLDLEVIKVTYQKVTSGSYYDFISKKSYEIYNYNRQEEKIKSFSVQTDSQGKYVYQQTVEPESSYEIKIKAHDVQGNYENYISYLYYHNGTYLDSYSGYNYSYYHLKVENGENKLYSLNETVTADFMVNDQPLPDGEQKYLFLQLQNGLQEYQVSSSHSYSFNFAASDIPNINLQAVYFNGTTYVATEEGYYNYQIGYNYHDKELQLDIITDKKAYQPGEEVTLDIKVHTSNNEPKKTEINVNLVDEAFYAIANDVATPAATIYNPVGSGSIFSFNSHNPTMFSRGMGGAEKGGCFVQGTEITMADGTKKAIEKITVGDKILTYQDPVSLKKTNSSVTRIFQHLVKEYLVINKKIKVTPAHLVYSNFRFTEAGQLKVGDWLLSESGEKIIINSIEIKQQPTWVYNFTSDPTHTYFAAGIYVHNEKGGGPREFFVDAALFQTVTTNEQGQARLKFKLPDNITSWRVTTQAVSADLYVGATTAKIPVSLPVFAEVTVSNNYLLNDQPIVRLRSYGTSLNKDQPVEFSLEAASLGLKKSEILKSTAFEAVYYQLPKLQLGRHDIVYNLSAAGFSDSLKLPITVVTSRLEGQVAREAVLNTDYKIDFEGSDLVTVVLSDQGQNKFYQDLIGLAWSFGDRVDQVLARKKAGELLQTYYKQQPDSESYDLNKYQLASGGVSLLTYSSEDLELALNVALLDADGFDKEALAQYFFRKLEDKNSIRQEVSYALAGLASLNKPVLTRLDQWLTRNDLSYLEKLYLALAYQRLGNSEKARTIYHSTLKDKGESKAPYTIIRVSDKQDEVFKATALAAILAEAVDAPEAPGFWLYVKENQKLYGPEKNSENLYILEKVGYLQAVLPKLKPSPSKVTYKLDGEERKIELTGGETHSFIISQSQAGELRFIAVEGQVGVTVIHDRPFVSLLNNPDSDLSIRREYYINGKKTNSFKEGDLIEVRIYPEFKRDAINGYYQITDILPSGLKAVTKVYQPNNNYDCHNWYPYTTEGQLVKYRLSRDWRNGYCGGDFFRYYAQVRNRGSYQVEPVLMQSLVNPNYFNYSESSQITVNP